jgi:ribosomal protection tetracycline resistance protein
MPVPSRRLKDLIEGTVDHHASQRWPALEEVTIRWRGSYGYLTGYLSEDDDDTINLCRIQYLGDPDEWAFAIWQASTDNYAESVLLDGRPAGHPNQALDTACTLYLADTSDHLAQPDKPLKDLRGAALGTGQLGTGQLGTAQTVTAVSVFERGSAVRRDSVTAGQIGQLRGLPDVRIGDVIGAARSPGGGQFPPPTLETVVVPGCRADQGALHAALTQLAEQDPLINLRQDDTRQEISVSLYGEVQKEVIQATLASEYGIAVTFRETTPIYVERPVGVGEGVEELHAVTNPFSATIGLRVGPAPVGSGVEFRLDVDVHSVPLYVFKRRDDFAEAMSEYVREALETGLFGWRVTDCVVTLTRSEYGGADGPPSKRGQLSTAGDFRKLTPLVIRQALKRAGTVVCEPVVRASVEVPADSIGTILPVLARLGAVVETPSVQGRLATIETVLPAARAHDLQQQLASLTGGEGVLESRFAGYEAVSGAQPRRGGFGG